MRAPLVLICVVLVALAGCAVPGSRDKLLLQGANAPGGPYSPGVDLGDLVFLAGQIGVDPATRQLVDGGIEAETHQVMANLRAVLEEAGLGFEDVVKTSVFLADVGDFAVMNGIYRSYFPEGAVMPARTTVQVAAIPRGARIEIDFIAARR
ncbi:MAG: Rid family detoxifying hydrolase [Planctomycetota bacterium]|nr:Rid family detoxifying hydrolase [Planctomycetota bacterium]MDA0933763.1 Rid family detoxifying hydrolase [Planctomycetota bacterium]